ncbi:MAG: hypothetical protein MI861_03985 [Pirellulales bacterium]|nr:hypothetical protein [Pirellulales bacterium]
MGLDATVMCNCFRDGKTTASPFPRDWLEVDDEGYLNLKAPHDSDENWGKQHEWEQSCCPHQGMDFASERISNWPGYRAFQAALGKIGWHNFPVLEEQLPNANGGLMPASASKLALAELSRFESSDSLGKVTVLVDTASGNGVYERIASYDGVFLLSGSRGVDVAVEETESLVLDRDTREILFRAIRFGQYRKSGAAISGDHDDLVWENLDTGQIFEAKIAISGKQIPWEDGRWENSDGVCRFQYPTGFHIEQRSKLVSDFEFEIRALKTVFQASVSTGNPVRWC